MAKNIRDSMNKGKGMLETAVIGFLPCFYHAVVIGVILPQKTVKRLYKLILS